MSDSTIIVPLDGSELSEKAVPFASLLAKVTKARLLLVTVWEEGERALISSLPDMAESLFKKGEKHWEGYLAGLANDLRGDGIDVATEILIGEPAAEILKLVERHETTFLVVATHGRAGLSRWRYGSTANRLICEASVPALVVGPRVLEGDGHEPAIRRLLVPLDGSALAEAALSPALDLAAKLESDILLAQVLPWFSQAIIYGVPDVNVAQVDEELTKAAESYLSHVRERLPAERNAEAVVLHGPVADAIITLVDQRDIDLVVMTSHSRTGVARAILGSVADRLLHGKAPVLLIRPRADATSE